MIHWVAESDHRFDSLQDSRASGAGFSTIEATTRENRSSWFLTRSDTNRPVHPQKIARNLKNLDLGRRGIVLSE